QSRRGRAVTAPALPLAGNPWRTGLVGNVLNPKIAVFYTGLLPALAPSGFSPRAGTAVPGRPLLVLVHTALTIVRLGSWVMPLPRARAFFGRPAVRRALDRVTGVLLIGFGIRVATSQP
ncbi:LysE family transporter, partial [Streptomyces sp. NPDC048279]|uniref:LysE family translocator n=1 Tax=Streptomyces sp. NPDC048279 TaxID=3154714 RepID=UPI00342D07EB